MRHPVGEAKGPPGREFAILGTGGSNVRSGRLRQIAKIDAGFLSFRLVFGDIRAIRD